MRIVRILVGFLLVAILMQLLFPIGCSKVVAKKPVAESPAMATKLAELESLKRTAAMQRQIDDLGRKLAETQMRTQQAPRGAEMNPGANVPRVQIAPIGRPLPQIRIEPTTRQTRPVEEIEDDIKSLRKSISYGEYDLALQREAAQSDTSTPRRNISRRAGIARSEENLAEMDGKLRKLIIELQNALPAPPAIPQQR